MLMLLRVRPHLLHFRCGNILGVDAAYSHTFAVYLEHDLRGPLTAQGENPLQHQNDEVHRCVIVIQKQNLEHRRRFGPAFLGLKDRVFALPRRHTEKRLIHGFTGYFGRYPGNIK